jgi:hypothetical protein
VAAAGARLAVVLCIALLAVTVLRVGRADAATMPELARPARARESTPLCAPECELITAPSEAAGGREYEGTGPGGGFTAQELREAYGLPEHGGAGVTIAVVEDLGDPAAEQGLGIYRETFGLPECTEADGCFRQVNEHGEPTKPRSFTSWAEETSLDLDMVSASCPECNILLVEGSGRAGRVEAIKTAVELGAAAVSNSWNFGFEQGNPANAAACQFGGCISEAEERLWNPKFNFPGVPILFSGGDYGYAVRYPADSPDVISVGGTRLRHEPEGGRGWSEEVWSNPNYEDDEKGRGTGSGCSMYDEKPTWETDPACPNRIENDVSADADPRSPVAVYDDYWEEWVEEGGTSASAPFVAGIEGLSTSSARELGAAAFWRAGEAGTLFDVTSGSDGTCTPPSEDAYWCDAEPGYDAPTGWGTPDGALLIEGPPVVETDAAESVSTVGATLRGRVDDTGVSGGTSCSFQVAATADPAFASPLATVPCEPSLVEGPASVPVSAVLTGLSPHTVYLFRTEGTNAEGGPVFGTTRSFETSAEPPEEFLESPGSITRTTAELRAEVDNKGAPAGTTCVFEVTDGEDVKFERTFENLPCDPGRVEGEGPVPVSAMLTGLSVNTTYLSRLTVTSSGGESDWIVDEITTLPEPPTVSTGGAGNVTDATAQLKGRVDDEGDQSGSTCVFQITTPGDGNFDAPVARVPCEPATVMGEEEVAVSSSVSGLAPSTEYLYRVEATNRGGSSFGTGRTFTTEAAPETNDETGPGQGSEPGNPVIITGPLDEAEIKRKAEEEAEKRAAEARGLVPTPAPGPSAPSNRFSIGRALRRGADLTITISVPGAGTISVSGGSAIRRTSAQAIAAGSLTLRVPLTAATSRRAAHDPKLRLKLLVTFTPTGGQAATKRLSVLVGRRASGR